MGCQHERAVRPEPGAASEGWLAPGRFATLLALFIVASFPNQVVGLGSFSFRDFGYFTAPLAAYHRDCFWRGDVFPLWNPLSNCGTPFLAQWNTMVMYPGTLIYLLTPFPWGLNAFMLAHLAFAGIGMYFLVRRWTGSARAAAFAGIAFVFNGMMLNCLMWSNYIASYGWMPWTVLWVERGWREGGRAWWLAVFAGSMQMLSGTPEIVLFTWLLLSGMLVARLAGACREQGWRGGLCMRDAGRFAGIVAMVAAVCAAQLLPFLEFLSRSQRHAEFGTGEWAMPPWGWANLLLPLFHTFPAHQGVHFQPTQFWTSSYYPGIAIVVLALWAALWSGSRRAWFLGVVAGLCLVLALGDAGGVYAAFRRWVPGSGFMRFPIKFVLLATFLWPCLAALAVARWERLVFEASDVPAKPRPRWLTGVAVLIGVLTCGLAALAWMRPLQDEVPRLALINGAGRVMFLAATLWAVGWSLGSGAVTRLPAWRGTLAPVLPLMLLWIDVMTHAPSQNPTAAAWVFDKDVQQMKEAPRLGEGRMMISAEARTRIRPASVPDPSRDFVFKRQALYDNCNLLDGIPAVDGMYSLFVREHDSIRSLLYGSGGALRPRLMDFLGVTWTTAPGELIQWVPRRTALPLVTAGQDVVIAEPANVLESMAGESWAPAKKVFASEGSGLSPGPRLAQAAHVKGVVWGAHRVSMEVEASGPTVVVVAQTWDRHWRATLDGRATVVARVNHAFQAVEVPADKSRLELSYVDPLFRVGLAVSGVMATVVAAGLFWCWRGGRRRAQTGDATQ